MKKIILLATFGVVGLVSAKEVNLNTDKNGDKSKETKSSQNEKVLQQCIQVQMYVWCTDEMVPDTMCWGEGAGVGCETYRSATLNLIRNSQLLTEYFCGEGTGSGL
ncbi:hypothetical protein [Chryseobacterium aquaticum]|uniref:hypothetical protein n=1 Tax=Chryseobacterium aquaticum TaxID=452084 RepID=UPI003F721060